MDVTRLWWFKHIEKFTRAKKRPVPILKAISEYLRQNPPIKPIKSPIPFAGKGGRFRFLVAGQNGLLVVEYTADGKRTGAWTVEEYFERASDRRKWEEGRRALANFHEFLARYVLPAG
ncbi:MAG: hypothetical protein J7K48_08025 [Thermococcus sp.]|nr:hypothetical protein [Thermococcus sp.]